MSKIKTALITLALTSALGAIWACFHRSPPCSCDMCVVSKRDHETRPKPAGWW